MRLATRVSLFFLGALALVLAGFSIAVYLLVADAIRQTAEEHLLTTFHALAAAVEIESDGVEWTPREHFLPAGATAGGESIAWFVVDDGGHFIDGSPRRDALRFALPWRDENAGHIVRCTDDAGKPWWVVGQRLSAADAEPQEVAASSNDQELDDSLEYPALTVLAGIRGDALQGFLRELAFWLSIASIAIWLVSAGCGRWYCQRALSPVARMARATGEIRAGDRQSRLPLSGTSDELHELGAAFNALLDRVQGAFERERQFTGEASHQLRTPLAILRGQVDVALRRERSPDEYREVLQTLHAQVRRLDQIVEALLFLSRAQAGAQKFSAERLDLAAWLPAHLERWKTHARQADLKLATRNGQPAPILANEALLAQLVDTLIENACKYSPAGTAIDIGIVAGAAANRVQLTVADHGMGITATDLPHVFEPFYRSQAAIHQGIAGVGLGLSVARRVAEVLPAEISVASEPGRGSRFTVTFPEVAPPAS